MCAAALRRLTKGTDAVSGSGFSADIHFKETVRARTDIVELIRESVALQPRRGGREFAGLCPFHDDHNPSLFVYPDRQTYRCWVCDEGGDCFSWVMKTEGVGFREALIQLAERAGLQVPRTFRPLSGGDANRLNRLREVLAWAASQFHQCLLHAEAAQPARAYLNDRGIGPELWERFRLGFHPNDWRWLLKRAGGLYSTDELQAAQLVRRSDRTGDWYDFFVDRVMFPICDTRGRVVAFGGRVLPTAPADSAKYWNSPESVLFSKSRLLYGLHLARKAITASRTAVVVEGYTDCILLHAAGFENCVGTLGTALTDAHVSTLKRFADRVVLVFDGDAAGRAAAERTVPRFLAQNVDLRILLLPEDKDPADFVRDNGADAFRGLLDRATEAWEFKLQAEMARFGTDSIHGREQVINAMLSTLAQSPGLRDSPRETLILQEVSRRLQVPETTLVAQLARLRHSFPAARPTGPNRRPAESSPAAAGSGTVAAERGRIASAAIRDTREDRLECQLLEILLTAPEWLPQVRTAVGPDDFQNAALRDVFIACCDLADEGHDPTAERVLLAVERAELRRIVFEIQGRAEIERIGELLEAADGPTSGERYPRLLRDVLEAFELRRELQQLEPHLRGVGASSASLDEEELL
ncbi:MAG: DNA primase, partial [Planctomycetota bacterium]